MGRENWCAAVAAVASAASGNLDRPPGGSRRPSPGARAPLPECSGIAWRPGPACAPRRARPPNVQEPASPLRACSKLRPSLPGPALCLMSPGQPFPGHNRMVGGEFRSCHRSWVSGAWASTGSQTLGLSTHP
jgi:hypothetical protein